MTKGQNLPSTSVNGALPVDAREALQWFVNNFGLYLGSVRGLFITDWSDERDATLEAAIINLKSRGFAPLSITGDALYKQADYLWKESRAHSVFGRPLASKVEIELSGADLVIVDNLEAPENARQLWYLYSHFLYPRAMAGKATIITSPLSYEEFVRYGSSCPDQDFNGKALNWDKLEWLIEASCITMDTFKLARQQGLPPMLKAEYALYTAMKERGLDVVPQHVLGDFLLDFALIDKDHKLNIECDLISALGGSEIQRQDATRNLVLLSDDWHVLKFGTAEIFEDAEACGEVVDDVWRSGRKRGFTGRLFTGNTVPTLPDLPVNDESQFGAIAYNGGPVAVTGGAGTGKTTCIIQRVAYLLGQGVHPENILVLTCTADTQKMLRRSIENLVDRQLFQRLTINSWHEFGLKILKENLPEIKRKPPLKVENNPQKIIQRLLAKVKKDIDPAKLELSVDLDEFYIAAVISMYKAHMISPRQAREDAANYGEEIVARIYQALEDQLQKANRIDRDDVVPLTVQVLLDNQAIRRKYQKQYEFVLVDEYQDVTVSQDMLARLIAAPQDNLFVVGDEDEALSESKNACPELFTEWSLRYPQARCFILEKNWRSHPAIVDHARQLLAGLERRRIQKELISAFGQAPASAIIGPVFTNTEQEEANWVADEIQLLIDSGRNFGDIAIVYRHNVYASILEEALNSKGVRYQASNPIINFVPDEVADMMAFLKLVMDPDGPRARESFERVCQLRTREIDPKLSSTIASFAEANNLSYLKAVEIYSEATADQSCAEMQQLVRIIRTMHQEKLPPAETIALIRRTQRLNDYYRSVKIPPGVNYEPLRKLTQFEEESRNFKTVPEFVKHMQNQQLTNGGTDAGVQVLSIADCRGQEHPVVFLVGLAQGIFPAENAVDIEEERRMCYVGFTRAKDLLYLSYPLSFSGVNLQPSQFLMEARIMAGQASPPAHQAIMPAPIAEPVYQQPVYEQPVMPTPIAEPVYQQPVYEQPVMPAPIAEPVYQQPVYEQPAHEEFVDEQFIYEEPAAMSEQQTADAEYVQRPAAYDSSFDIAAETEQTPSFDVYAGQKPAPRRLPMPGLPRGKAASSAAEPQSALPQPPSSQPLAPQAAPVEPQPGAVGAPPIRPLPVSRSAFPQGPQSQSVPPAPSMQPARPVQAAQHAHPSQQSHSPQITQQPQQPAFPVQQQVPAAAPVQEQPQAVPGQPVCPTCANPLEVNARFCGECGYTLPERIPGCPTCGAPLEVTAKFCGECGMQLLSPPTPSSSPGPSAGNQRMQQVRDQQTRWVDKLFKILES